MKSPPQPAGENAREWLNTDSPPKITPKQINMNFLKNGDENFCKKN